MCFKHVQNFIIWLVIHKFFAFCGIDWIVFVVLIFFVHLRGAVKPLGWSAKSGSSHISVDLRRKIHLLRELVAVLKVHHSGSEPACALAAFALFCYLNVPSLHNSPDTLVRSRGLLSHTPA